MAALFTDPSALVRRYDKSEPDAQRVRRACAPSSANLIFVARLASAEFASALARKVREGRLTVPQRDRHWRLFRGHWRAQYHVVGLSDQVFTLAEQLLFRHRLRAGDALHLAAALIVGRASPALSVQFWTADKQQAAAAQREGLLVTLLA
ncbi:MAG: type II toxin-antitoxin system VapC family toxin [Chloroflexi bacterium]|nr:type II toxin-antitoxin system VapC family toxin [Chloroflexota bacterium]